MPVILAHGIGIRSDLPISRQLFVTNGALVVIATFVVLTGFWQTSRLRGNAVGVPVPHIVERVVDATVTRVLVRLVALAVSVFVLVVGAVGPSAPDRNLAPQVLFITFWVGLVPASLLLGPVWRVLNPLRTMHSLWARAAGVSPGDGLRQLPARLGYWPAAASLFPFVSYELVIPNHAAPFHVVVFVVLYALIQLVGAFVYGSEWFAHADAFEVYSTLIARMAFLGRRDDGRLVLRSPFNGLDGTLMLPGLVGFLVVLLGSTAFDGVERTGWWQRTMAGSVLKGFAGLVLMIAFVGVLYYAATRAADLLGGVKVDLSSALAHSLIPIAVGYSVAHYLSLFIFDGQMTWILASDPFQRGTVNYFGTARHVTDNTVVSIGVIAAVRAGAIVVGHVLGTIAAHDRVLRLLPPRRATRAQLPLLVLMVLFTMGGLLLILA